ncbi:MAG: hypothetical protein V1914_00140 [archaeon]
MANLKSIVKSTFLAGAVVLSSLGLCPGRAHAADKDVYRDEVSINTNYATFNINGEEYQKGVSLDLESKFGIPVREWLDIQTNLKFNHHSYSSLDKKSTETIDNLELKVGGKVELYSSNGLKFYLDMGGKYLLNHEKMVFERNEAYIMGNLWGPSLAVGIEGSNFDFSISLSTLLGIEGSSYEKDYGSQVEQLSVNLTPRFWRIEVPMECELFFQSAAEYKGYYPNLLLKFTLKPGIALTEHVGAFINITHSNMFLEEYYETFDVGGGFKIKW